MMAVSNASKNLLSARRIARASNLGAVNFELGMLALFLRENDINLGTLPYGACQFDFGTVQKRGVFDN